MNRKVLGVLVSIVMAALGTFVVLSYVRDADERAVAGQETVQVLVVSDTIEKGSSPDEVASRVESVLIPAKTQAIGSVSNLDDLGDSVTSVDLVPGEQLLFDCEFTVLIPGKIDRSSGIDQTDSCLQEVQDKPMTIASLVRKPEKLAGELVNVGAPDDSAALRGAG